jgi:hypothetical protein
MAIWLYDKETNSRLVELDADQLEELQDALEEEFSEDHDYYIDADTIDYLAQAGVNVELLEALRGALGDREGMDVLWRNEP